LSFFRVSSFFQDFLGFLSGFWVFFRFLLGFGVFWVLGASAGEKRNLHPNPILRGLGSGSGHGCKNAPEPAPVGCKTRGLPEIQTQIVIPSHTLISEQSIVFHLTKL
jgi:hypothetical protein